MCSLINVILNKTGPFYMHQQCLNVFPQIWYKSNTTRAHTPVHSSQLDIVESIYLHQQSLKEIITNNPHSAAYAKHVREWLDKRWTSHLLDVIVKPPYSKIWNILIFSQTLRILRRKSKTRLEIPCDSKEHYIQCMLKQPQWKLIHTLWLVMRISRAMLKIRVWRWLE